MAIRGSAVDVRLHGQSAGRQRAAQQKCCGGGSSKPINDALRVLVFDVDRAVGAARTPCICLRRTVRTRNPDNGHARARLGPVELARVVTVSGMWVQEPTATEQRNDR
jgi:hypothetical protein